MANKRMKFLSTGTRKNTHWLIRWASQEFLSAIIQTQRDIYIFSRGTIDIDSTFATKNVINFDLPISSACSNHTAIVIEGNIIDLIVMMLIEFLQRGSQYLVAFIFTWSFLFFRVIGIRWERTRFFEISGWDHTCLWSIHIFLSLLKLFPLFFEIELLFFDLFVLFKESEFQLIHVIEFLGYWIFIIHVIG